MLCTGNIWGSALLPTGKACFRTAIGPWDLSDISPSYALGNAYGAQFFDHMKAEIDVPSAVSRGDFSAINEWNRKKIWQYGMLYSPTELIEKAVGEKFDPSHYTAYLTKKYTKIYGL